ncbi:hypothetical protein [Colwellia sp. MEBiC06753]
MQANYYLDFYSSGYQVALTVNEFPIVSELSGQEVTTTQIINRWLGQKNNRAHITLTIPTFTAKDPDDQPSTNKAVRINIFKGEERDGKLVAIDNLVQLELSENDPIIQQMTSPDGYEISFPQVLSDLPLTRLWQYAETMEQLSQQDKYDIFLVLKGVRSFFAKKQFEQAYEFFKYRYEDEEIADHIPKGQLQQSVLAMWKQYLADPELSLVQYAAESVAINWLDNKRVAQIVVNDGQYPIEFVHAEQDMSFGFPLFLCKINGQWIIIR